MRFCEDYFGKAYKQTIGVDFFVKRLEMPNDIQVALQVWDIGGQSIFGKMLQTYIYEANSVKSISNVISFIQIILVYDITNQASFQDLEDWLGIVKKAYEGKELPIIILMGNKIDLAHMQAVKTEQHEAFVKKHSLHAGYYVSAKSGDQVQQCFYKIAAELAGIEVPKPVMDAVASQKMVRAEIQTGQSQNIDNEPSAI